jgi:Core-2/I-Branching enzyme
MRIAYLIMTHENPKLLQQTINTLSHGDNECGFFIHLDRKTAFDRFSSIGGQNVRFVERIPVYWGEFSQVEAILSLVHQAIEDPSDYDYLALITGSCYPLRTGGYIRMFFEGNRGLEYMDILKVPGPGKPISRFDTIRYPSDQAVRRFAFRALAKIGLAQRDHRKCLGGLEPYSGDGAWALTREACRYVLDFMSANPHLESFFRKTFASDEAFFHTILGNSEFRSHMRRNLVYAVWPGPANGHPAVIGHEHVASFERQDQVSRDDIFGPGELLFARKFNDGRLDVVRRVDAMIERKEGVRVPSLNETLQTELS